MSAVFLTAISALLLIYADLGGWPALAILGLVCATTAAVTLPTEKYGPWLAGSLAAVLISCDAATRYNQAQLSALHNSVTFGDFTYATCIFATIGWASGRILRNKHVVKCGRMEIVDAQRPTLVVSPVFVRRKPSRAINQ
jgi:hypothetical protein